MRKHPRWMKSVIETAKTETTALPWQRGARRAAMIVRRTATDTKAHCA